MKVYSNKGIDNKTQIKHEEHLQWRGVFWDFRFQSFAGYIEFFGGEGGLESHL
jgi:hypothetical protein